ncbi:MAG: hypothetical protein JJU28_16705 [Cyclobacteriaceae bacterium]|nr:hypothetical protein [Cyclobacteriaceae bacterium]
MKRFTKWSLLMLLPACVYFMSGCSKEETEPNKAPVLEPAADVIGITDTNINLMVNAMDPDGDALSYDWKISESPAGSSASLSVNTPMSATFSTQVAGYYQIQVLVDDGRGGKDAGFIKLYIGGRLPTSITSNTTLPDLFTDETIPDYYASQNVLLRAGLTLEPGVVLECGADITLNVSDNTAFLKAEGLQNKKIIIRGISKNKGSWRGINISSSNVANSLNHVTLLHAGSNTIGGKKCAIRIQSNVSARIGIQNSLIAETAGYGLFVDGNDGILSSFSNNKIDNNDAAPMLIAAENTYALDNNSTYSGNGINAIEVAAAGNVNARFINAGTMKNAGIPYHINSSIEIRNAVTVEAGTTCLFNSGLRIWVTAEGSLNAKGSNNNIITFSSVTQVAGAWRGIEIHTSSPLNIMDYCIISYGGNSSGRGANIYMFGSTPGAQLTLTNSTISHSQTYGLRSASGSISLTQNNNSFTSNANGDIRQD